MVDGLSQLPLGKSFPVGAFGVPGPAGVSLQTQPRSVCVVVAGRDRAALFAALNAAFAADFADAAKVVAGCAVEFIGIAPGAWLVLSEEPDLFERLERAVGATAGVFEQSGGLVVLEATGPDLTRALAKLIPLDLHPAAFPIGSAATTTAAHVNLTLWRADVDRFCFAVGRSYLAACLRAFAAAAAEFGFSWRG